MRRLAVVLFGLLFVVAACGGAAQAPSGGGSTEPPDAEETKAAEGDPTPGTALTACQIVTAADIEAALELEPGTVSEGTLEEQPTVLDPAVNQCSYQDEAWGGLIVNVTPTDGANVYDALADVYGDEAEALQIGDGALWFDKNNRGYFFKGSVLFFLQFTHITVDVDTFRDPTVTLGEAGVGRI